MIDLGQLWELVVSHSLGVSLKLGVLILSGRAQDHVDLEYDAKT